MKHANIELGNFELCLNVKDLTASVEFYKKLGFEMSRFEPGESEGWASLERRDLVLSLYVGCIKETILNFRGADVFETSKQLTENGVKFEKAAHIEADKSQGATIRDPDGNLIYLNTSEGETI